MIAKDYSFTGKKVGILGLARSGLSAARLMLKAGAYPFVSDYSKSEEVIQNGYILNELSIPFEVGGHTPRLYQDQELIIISPGIPQKSPIVEEIKKHRPDLPLLSELEAAFYFNRGRIIAITGSNGKSTTVALTGKILADAGIKTFVGGNIGIPFSSFVQNTTPDCIVVLEISSFQLDNIINFYPWIAMILNLTPDHLNRYEDLEHYYSSKERIFMNQGNEDYLILNYDDPEIQARIKTAIPRTIYFSRLRSLNRGAFIDNDKIYIQLGEGSPEAVMGIHEPGLKGPHNLWNILAALTAATLVGVKVESAARTIQDFKGIEHRLENVGSIGQVKFINDSKATNVDSVYYALQSYKEKLVLILGGQDKGGDFSRLKPLIEKRVNSIILLGEASEKIAQILHRAAPIRFSRSMKEAVEMAYELAYPDRIVLLSPGCASFDMYRNFEERGKDFKNSVERLANKKVVEHV
ncbi:UDP-N-acetylmuramoyl-L-alanine--D-glutamate ligase [bacterium]|nr:UDP-N-acetylmuramoyl-L-alanine--D-glutamate ligase [bacterium]